MRWWVWARGVRNVGIACGMWVWVMALEERLLSLLRDGINDMIWYFEKLRRAGTFGSWVLVSSPG